MNFIKGKIHALGVITLLVSINIQADITHVGTILSVNNHTLSGDASLSESWSWIQLSELAVSGACEGSDIGTGNLAHIAFPDSEKINSAVVLSAYLDGQAVRAIIDDTNLYQGKCRLKQLALGVSSPLIQAHLDSNYTDPLITLDPDKLQATADASNLWLRSIADIGVSSGKWVFEVEMVSGTNTYTGLGFTNDRSIAQHYVGQYANSWGYLGNGYKSNSGYAAIGHAMSVGSKAMIHLDLDVGTISVEVDNGGIVQMFTGLPAGTYYPLIGVKSSNVVKVNFGEEAFTNSVPTGFNSGIYQE